MQKKNLIVLHGWGLSSERFTQLVRELKHRGYRVFAPDLPGFGKSQLPPAALTLADYASFLDRFIREKKIKKPILIGHSFGGRVSLKYQLLYPDNIQALILTGTPGFTPIARRKLLLFIILAKIGGAFFSLPPFSLMQNKVRIWYYYLVGAKEFYRAQGSMRETFKKIVQEELVTAMRAVKVPCLLIWGDQDTIVPVAIARRMQEIIVGSQLELVSGVSHSLPFKDPVVFADYCERFLQLL